jgi:hypothetical protein
MWPLLYLFFFLFLIKKSNALLLENLSFCINLIVGLLYRMKFSWRWQRILKFNHRINDSSLFFCKNSEYIAYGIVFLSYNMRNHMHKTYSINLKYSQIFVGVSSFVMFSSIMYLSLMSIITYLTGNTSFAVPTFALSAMND